MLIKRLALIAAFVACASTAAATPTPLFVIWPETQMDGVLSRTQRLTLAPDVSALSAGEKQAVQELLAAGDRVHRIYMQQRHPQALSAADFLADHAALTKARDLFWMNLGPIATTLENTREPFVSVAQETPARNMYPQGTTRAIMDSFLTAHPERRDDILDDRTVVWTANAQNLARAINTLRRYPVLETLHPGIREKLTREQSYLSVPYSIAYADDILFVVDRLNGAANDVAAGDPAFARYLRLRARDLMADDYEGGDAAWVTGRFSGNLNAQIGAYETYDDALYGVKTFFSLSVLVRDVPRSNELKSALEDIQLVENALPYDNHRTVRSDIPVGVYNIVADFGQARGTNTASILPNEAYLARQYGRTILIRGNILLNDEIFQETQRAFAAAVVDPEAHDLTPEGGFYRTLWHEIGHYCGVDLTADGRDLDTALQDSADLFEEMKADLVSLTSARILHDRGKLTDAQLRGIYAAGIRRVLQKNRPRRDQPYQTMQLMQWNWFMDKGALTFENGRLNIHYDRYPAAVESLLREVLAIQRTGNREAANAFVDRWTTWRPDLHEAIAQNMRASERARFTLVTYAAIPGPNARQR